MRFDQRRLLSWLLPCEEPFAAKELWDTNSLLPGNISWGLYCKTLDEFVKKGYLQKTPDGVYGVYSMTKKGIIKREEINKKRNC